MNTKNLSFKQVCWAQELFSYHFQIDYWQKKANAAVNAVSWLFKMSQAKKLTLRDENTYILLQLQNLLTKANIRVLSLSDLVLTTGFSPLYQVFVYGTYILLRLNLFWNNVWNELVHKKPYQQVSMRIFRLLLPER